MKGKDDASPASQSDRKEDMTQGSSQVRTRFEEPAPEARIGYVTIDNARKLNTLNSPLMQDLISCMRSLGSDARLRAVVLEGAGSKAFIGGANIDELLHLDPSSARSYITLCHECCDAVRSLPVPVIARIDGYTIGAGLEIAISCDLRAASTRSIFAMPEVKLGLPSVVEAALLPSLVGWGRAREILLLGESFTAQDAAQWGMVERVVEAGELEGAISGWLRSLVSADARAVRMQKRLMRAWEDLPLRGAVKTGIDCFAEAWESEIPRKAVQHFVAAERHRKAAAKAG